MTLTLFRGGWCKSASPSIFSSTLSKRKYAHTQNFLTFNTVNPRFSPHARLSPPSNNPPWFTSLFTISPSLKSKRRLKMEQCWISPQGVNQNNMFIVKYDWNLYILNVKKFHKECKSIDCLFTTTISCYKLWFEISAISCMNSILQINLSFWFSPHVKNYYFQ